MPWLISALGITIEKMKVGEFTRKLKEAVNAEGYTCNNVDLLGFVEYLRDATNPISKNAFCVELRGNDGNEFKIFIEED